jgi:hypothetical protein
VRRIISFLPPAPAISPSTSGAPPIMFMRMHRAAAAGTPQCVIIIAATLNRVARHAEKIYVFCNTFSFADKPWSERLYLLNLGREMLNFYFVRLSALLTKHKTHETSSRRRTRAGKGRQASKQGCSACMHRVLMRAGGRQGGREAAFALAQRWQFHTRYAGRWNQMSNVPHNVHLLV